jgi:hypothetical protein
MILTRCHLNIDSSLRRRDVGSLMEIQLLDRSIATRHAAERVEHAAEALVERRWDA